MDSRFRGNDSLRESIEGERQSRFISCRGIPVQDTLVNGVIDKRQGGLQKRFRGGLILGFERGAEFPDLMPQPRQVRPVQFRALLGLLDAL
jgi:hypothetical protein